MDIKTIVVGVDFSDNSRAAVQQAEALARQHGAKLVLVHGSGVTDSGMYVSEVAGREDEPWRVYVHDQLRLAKGQLASLAERQRAQGLEVEEQLVSEFGGEAVVAQAGASGADLVVVGTHGRTGFDRILLGSVAERVVRLSPCHVLVARARDTQSPGIPRRLLVPTDFSSIAELGLELALSVAAPGAQIELFHAWVPPYQGGGDYLPDWMRADLKAEADKRGRALLAKYARPGVELSLTLREATPAPGIQKRLEENGFDAVVIGSHGRRGLRRLLLGSVAERTVRYAPVSVYVAHG